MVKCLKILSVVSLLFFVSQLSAQNMQLLTLNPQANENYVSADSDIILTFDQIIDSTTFNDSTVIVRGSQTGIISGVYNATGNASIAFDPDQDFRPGEIISFTITTRLKSNGGLALTRGHTYSFTVVTGTPAATSLTLAQRTVSGGGSQGRDAKALDYDRDGDLDIIASHEGLPEQIIVFENDGNMGFCGYSTGGNFRNLEVYDIDGDGDYDNFGATGAFDTEINWFENEGSVPYTERFISSEDPWTLAGGDIDSDGDIDLVAAVILPNRILWFANDGAGNFSSAMSIPTTFTGGSDSYFHIRDIDADGAMDILAFHRDDFNLVWYQNNGNQVFTEKLIANTTNRMRPGSADLDGDGDIDVFTVSVDNSPTAPISWFENDGSENFTEHPIAATSAVRLFTVSSVDIDGDLDMDLLAGAYWFENDGSQNFSEHTISDGLKVGTNYFAFGINYADMDADGDMDIISLSSYATAWQENIVNMSVTQTSPANAQGNVAEDAVISITFDQAIDATSINPDNIVVFSQYRGHVDGILSGGGSTTISFDPVDDFLPGDKIEVSITDNISGTAGQELSSGYGFAFQVKSEAVLQPAFSTHPLHTFNNNVSGLDVADIDGDGDLDLLSCSFAELFWHRNDGSGNFTTIPITTTGTPVGVFVIDQNEDGFMDILADTDGNNASLLYTNDGNQNFSESILQTSGDLKQLTDVNRDGDIDLVYLLNTNTWLRWGDNRCGVYGFQGFIPQLANRGASGADMDNDGDIDFVAASTIGSHYLSNGDFLIFANQDIDDNSTVNQVLADLDGDGDFDPIFVENFSAIIWYENRLTEDSLDFGERQEIGPLPGDPRDVIAVDIDGDGDADIAAVSRNDDKVVWYQNRLNEVTADFGPAETVTTAADGPVRIMSGDLDGDGDEDLVTLSDQDDEINWYENTGTPAAIGDGDQAATPLTFKLRQNYPNPFNPSTTIAFQLPGASMVTLDIHDILGRHVTTPYRASLPGGTHKFVWDATDSAGNHVASGIYYYRLTTPDFVQTRKMLLVR